MYFLLTFNKLKGEYKMNKKHFIHFLIIAVVFLFGYSFAFAEDITLQFTSWMVAEESGGEEWLPERIAEWEKMHPGVKVEIIPLGWEDTPDKITMQIQANNAPDIFTIESLWLGKFGKMPKGVEDLNKYMDAEFTSQLVPAYKGGEIDGKMAGLVWNPNPWVLVYNQELAKKAGVSGQPKDFNDFLKQARAVSDLGPDIYGFGMMLSVGEYDADTFHIIMWPLGGDLLDGSGNPVVNSSETMEAVKLVKDGVDTGWIPFGEGVRNLRTIFALGKIGFFFEGPWIAGVLDGEGMSRDEWDVAPWPGQVQPASHILCMSQQSEHKDLAWDLMKFIVTDEVTTKEYFKRTGLMPLVASQYKDPIYDNNYSKTFLAQMSNLRNPNVWSSQKKFEIEIAFMEELQRILLGGGDVEKVLNKLNDRLKNIIAE